MKISKHGISLWIDFESTWETCEGDFAKWRNEFRNISEAFAGLRTN
ncbi:MAG: hypothetical protein ACEY26_00695 [Candidatus Hodgkinia cicadicola]